MTPSRRNTLESELKDLNFLLACNTHTEEPKKIKVSDLEDSEIDEIYSSFNAGMKKGRVVRCPEKWSLIRWTK